MTLEEPVDWGDGNKVSIFLLALNNYSKEGFTRLYKIITDKSKIKLLVRSASFDQLMEVLLNNE